MECLDDNAVAEFVSGALAAQAITKVEKHLAGCRDCRALVAALAHPNDIDSQAETRQRERVSESQAGKLPQKKLSVGDRVGKYLVLSTLGAGGMGVVFAAYDPELDRKVALKVLRANLGANMKEARARLKREAQAIARLSHPNVVGVYEVGPMEDGDVYIAMEFVEGDNLTTWLKRWPRTWREIIDVFQQAGRGLAAAHSVGLLHRDFKPDNVLVGGDGRVRVTDFGLARSLIAPEEVPHPRPESSPLHAEITATGTVLGTPRYMAPEQLTGPDIDARADQFSFCVALYEALYGTHPLPGATSVAMLEEDKAALPVPENTRVPASIGRAVSRGLAKERAKRFPTMALVLDELAPPPARAPARVALYGVLGLVLVAGATAAVMSRPPASEHAAPSSRVDELLAKLDRAESEKRHLIEELHKKELDLQRLQAIETQVAEKDKQIDELFAEVTKLKAQQVHTTAAKPPDITQQIQDAVATAQHNLEGCFDEWSQRQALEAIDGFKSRPPTSAELIVHVSVTPDGLAHDAAATGEQEPLKGGTFREVHAALSFCVEAAVGRVRFPAGNELLDLDVAVAWEAPDVVNTSARIVGRHEAPRQGVDLQ